MNRLRLYMAGLRERVGPTGLGPVFVLLGASGFERLGISAASVLGPNVRDHFGVSNATLVTALGLVSVLPALLSPLAGYLNDRMDRVRFAMIGAAAFAVVGIALGLSPAFWVFAVLLLLRGVGLLINTPTHLSLITDFYPAEAFGETFTFYLFATAAVGLVAGPVAGGLGQVVGWRAAFVIGGAIEFAGVWLLTRIKDPGRGASLGVSFDNEEKPSFAEGFRRVAAVRSLRRTWWAAAFFGGGVAAFTSLQSVFFKDVYHYSAFARGAVLAVYGLGGLVGTVIGGRLVSKWMEERGADWLPVITGLMVMLFGVGIVLLGLLPWSLGGVVMVFVLSIGAAGFNPAYTAMIGLVTTPRLRGQAYSYSLLWVTLGALVVLPIIGGISNDHERVATWVLGAIVIVAGAINFSVRQFVLRDIAQATALREAGDAPALLTIRGVEAAYGNVQILFGVDLDVHEGEIVALLGTNGAGKSTLLRAASGLMDPIGGAVFFAGRDVTHADAMTHALLGMAMVPGDRGVFPGLSVADNLRLAAWTFRRNDEQVQAATERVLEYFPVLRERWRTHAGNLSGGEQQMLVLAQALMGEPKLLMIDELSLGLSPIIVGQLLDTVKRLAADGTTVVLVEQSVNVALTVAERAVFMEKGEVRFAGPTADLLERPDVLRAVFLEGAASAVEASNGKKGGAVTRARRAGAATTNGTRHVMLEVDEVSKRFGGVAANTDVSLELHAGEILGILGANGAGKTTLFDLISGFYPVDSGRIFLDGVDVTRLGPDGRARLGLGRSFQDSRLFPGLTITDTLRVALERHLAVKDPVAAALHLPAVIDAEAAVDERVDELSDMLGLNAFRNKFISEISTGTRRMVDLACILAHEPKVILFDEPSSGIAQRESEALGPLLKRIREITGSSLIVIEHDMPLLTGLADEVVAMELGSVLMRGTPHEVVNDPRVVAAYLGTNEAATMRSGTRSTTRKTTRTRVGAKS